MSFSFVKLQLHGAIYRPDSFVLMLCHCVDLKAIRYESTSLNRIAADKSHRVIVALSIHRRFLLCLAVSLSFDFICPISAAICDISLLRFRISFTYLFPLLMWPLSFGAPFPFLVYFFHSVAFLYIMQLCLQRNSVGSLTSEDVSSSIFTAIWSNSLDSLTDGFFFTKLFSVLISKFPGWDLILWNVSSMPL